MTELDAIPKPTGYNGSPQNIEVDDAVTKNFPEGSKLRSAKTHGGSHWPGTARIDLEMADGTPHSFFLKTGTGSYSMGICRGEYWGAKAIHKFTPGGIPRPVAWGTYVSDRNTHFYLCEFVYMEGMKTDDPKIRIVVWEKFSKMLAKLHRECMVSSDSPGLFGFPFTTYEGRMPQVTSWCTTWEEFFRNRLQHFVDQERDSRGPSAELDVIVPRFMDKIIPHLLRPLMTHGRTLNPALLHGDVLHDNMAIDKNTRNPIFFDPAVFWGHNEYDLCSMATTRYGLRTDWMEAYHEHFPISEPKGDYEDRNALYAISGHFCASTLYPEKDVYRKMAIEDMKKLLEKFPDGYQGE